ncbi:hypothetical protein KM043_013880 [Ampulex compressa]|nr:hypothetical protein KM043_013880 [Ampulex compressa]
MSNELESLRGLVYEEEFIDVSRLDVTDIDVWLYTPIEQPAKSADVYLCAFPTPSEDCGKRYIDSRTFTRPKKRTNRNIMESIRISTPDAWRAACIDTRNPEIHNINTHTETSSEEPTANHRTVNYFPPSSMSSAQESTEAFVDALCCKSTDSFMDLTEPDFQDSLINLSPPSMLSSSILSITKDDFSKFTESLSKSCDKNFLDSSLCCENAEKKSDKLIGCQADLKQTYEVLIMPSAQCSTIELFKDIENVRPLTSDFSKNTKSVIPLKKDVNNQGFSKDIESLEQLKMEVSTDIKNLGALTSEVSKDIENLSLLTSEFSRDIENIESLKIKSPKDIKNVEPLLNNCRKDIRNLETVMIEDSKHIENMEPSAINFSKDIKSLDATNSTKRNSTFLLEEPNFKEPLKCSTKLNLTFNFSDKPKEICTKNINAEFSNDAKQVLSKNIDTTFFKDEEEISLRNIDTTLSNDTKEISPGHVNTTFINDGKNILLKSKMNIEIPDNSKELSALEKERRFFTFVKKSNTKMNVAGGTKCNAVKSNLSRLPQSLRNSNSSLSVDSTRVFPKSSYRVMPKFSSECGLSELKVDECVESNVEINSEVDDGLSTCSEGRGSSCGSRTMKMERIRSVVRMQEKSLRQNTLIIPKQHVLENFKGEPPLSPIMRNGLGPCNICPSSPLSEDLPIRSSSPLIPFITASRSSSNEGETKESVEQKQYAVGVSQEVQAVERAEVKTGLRLPTNWNIGARSAIPRPTSRIPALRPTRQSTKNTQLDRKLRRP